MFRRAPFQCVINFGYRKILCFRGICHDFLSNFFVSQYRNISQRNPSVQRFRNVPVAKKFMDKRGWEYQAFLLKTFCLTVPKNLVTEAFFGAIRKNSSSKKRLWIRGRRKYQYFPSKLFFSSHSAKTFLENSSVLCFRKIPVAKKFMDKRWWEYQYFPSKLFFSSHSAETFLENSSVLCFRKIPVAEKFMDKRWWEYQVFLSKTFRLTVPKSFEGEPVSVSLTSGIEKFYASEGNVTIFCRKVFVSQYRNISQRNRSVLCFRKLPVAKKFMHKKEGEVSLFTSNSFFV